jgi:hypothetical protein
VETEYLVRRDLKRVQISEKAEAEAILSGTGQIQLEMVL